MPDVFHHGEIWGDGAGGPAALGDTYQPGPWIYTGVDSKVLLSVVLGGSADPTSLELQVEWRDNRTQAVQVLDVRTIVDPGTGVVEVDPQTLELPGTRDTYSATLNLPRWTVVRLQAKRTGGAGATLLVTGQARPPAPFDRAGGGGGGGPPDPHAASHQDGGADELDVTGLSGLLGDPQTPTAHASTHEDGGADEIDVTGLSGLLADPQTPAAHGHDFQDVYDQGPAGGPLVLLDSTVGALRFRDAATPIGDVLVLESNGGDPFFVVAPERVDVGASARRLFVATDYPNGKGGLRFLPDGGTFTDLNSQAALQWDSVVTTQIPAGGGIGNDTAPAMVASIGECIFNDQGMLFSSSLLFNQATTMTANGFNLGPVYTMVNQPLIRCGAAGGSRTCSQHNAVRAQPRIGPNVAGSITQTSVELFFATIGVNATVGSASVTTAVYFAAKSPTLTAGGTIGTLTVLDIAAITGPTTIRGINSALAAAAGRHFIRHTGTAVSTLAGDLHMANGVPLVLGSEGASGAELLRPAAGTARLIGRGGTNNEGLDFDLDSFANNVSITSPTTAGLNLDLIEMAIGPSTVADGTNNWFFAFAPGLRSTQLAGDYSECLWSSASAIQVAHAISNFATWTINAPSAVLSGGSVVTAANLLVQTSMGVGTNRYGLLVTSNPSGGTLNRCARFQGAAGVRVDGLFEHLGTSLGFYGASPVAQAAAYTPTNVSADRAYDANATTLDELADVLGTLIGDLQAVGLVG